MFWKERVVGFTEERKVYRYRSLKEIVFSLSYYFPFSRGFSALFRPAWTILLGEKQSLLLPEMCQAKCIYCQDKMASFSPLRHHQQENLWLLSSLKKKKKEIEKPGTICSNFCNVF